MQLFALNSALRMLGPLPYFNLQWNRRYYACGDFSVQILARDYRPEIAYLFSPDRPETGIVQKVDLSSTIKGEFVQLSGFFLEKLPADRIVYPTFYGSGNLAVSVRAMMAHYASDLGFQFGAAVNLGASTVWQETGATAEEAAYKILQTQELSYRITYQIAHELPVFEVWQGLDRTQEQNVNAYATFSRRFRNLPDFRMISDTSNYKNYAVIGGSGEGAQRITAVLDLAGTGPRKEIFIDAKSEAYDAQKQTMDEYLLCLRQKGMEKLQSYASIFNVTFDVSAIDTPADLGDKCDIVIDELQLALTARVIEIKEVHKNGTQTRSFTFGNQLLTSYQKARL